MIQIVWMFEAKPGHLAEFEKAYGVEGDWVQLFRKAEQYVGTVLLRDTEHANRFLTIDRWLDLSSFESFKRRYQAEYTELDLRCEGLTLTETNLGTFRS